MNIRAALLLSHVALAVALNAQVHTDYYARPYSPTYALWPNNGQVADTEGDLRPDVVATGYTQGLGVTLAKSSTVYFSYRTPAFGLTPAFIHRIAFKPIGEMAALVDPDLYETTGTTRNYYYAHCPSGVLGVPGYYMGLDGRQVAVHLSKLDEPIRTSDNVFFISQSVVLRVCKA